MWFVDYPCADYLVCVLSVHDFFFIYMDMSELGSCPLSAPYSPGRGTLFCALCLVPVVRWGDFFHWPLWWRFLQVLGRFKIQATLDNRGADKLLLFPPLTRCPTPAYELTLFCRYL
jgi:hypothetical protein